MKKTLAILLTLVMIMALMPMAFATEGYTITYDPGTGGSGTVASTSKDAGTAATLSTSTFSRDGYTQTGWAESDGGAQVYSLGGSYTKDENATLYPSWTANTYTVTYNPGANGTGSAQTDTKTGGTDLTLKGALFTRSGYTQTGWTKTDGSSTQDYALNGTYPTNASVTLYPVWTVAYTVTYKPGSTGTGTEQTVTKAAGASLTLKGETFTRTGYVQNGWTKTDGGSKDFGLGGLYTDDANQDLYPTWAVGTYTVTYKPGANGTGTEQTATKTGGTDLTLAGALFTRTGYTQTGWATTDGGAQAYALNGTYTTEAAIELYPVWTPDTYTVTYNPGSSGTGDSATDTKTYGTNLTLKGAIFTRSGYTQTGWATSDGGSQVYALSGTYSNNEAVTLYPVWTTSYTVTYAPGASGTGSQTTATKVAGKALTLPGAIFTRTGYTQTGWATSDGGAQVYALNASYTTDAATTLYPVWTVSNFTVTMGKYYGGTLGRAYYGYDGVNWTEVTSTTGTSISVGNNTTIYFKMDPYSGYYRHPYVVNANGSYYSPYVANGIFAVTVNENKTVKLNFSKSVPTGDASMWQYVVAALASSGTATGVVAYAKSKTKKK